MTAKYAFCLNGIIIQLEVTSLNVKTRMWQKLYIPLSENSTLMYGRPLPSNVLAVQKTAFIQTNYPLAFFPCRLVNKNQPNQYLGPLIPTGHLQWAPRPTHRPLELSLGTTNSQSPSWHQVTLPCPGWSAAASKESTPAPTFVIWKDEIC